MNQIKMQEHIQSNKYVYPVDINKCYQHRKATVLFKRIYTDPMKTRIFRKKCQCCKKIIGELPEPQLCYNPLQLSIYGQGLPLYFMFFKSIIILLIVCILFSIISFMLNLSGNNCQKACRYNTIAYKSSLLNQLNSTTTVVLQKWLLVIQLLILIVIMVHFENEINQNTQLIDEVLTSPSDYSIILRQLPSQANQNDILDMVKDMKLFLTQNQSYLTDHLAIQNIIMGYDLEQYIGIQEENLKNFKISIEQNTHFIKLPQPHFDKTSRTAVVTFRKQSSKEIFLNLETHTVIDSVIGYFWGDYIPLSNRYRVCHEYISVNRAPEPDDIIWKNCGYSTCQLFLRKIFFMLISLLMLSLGAFLQYQLVIWRRKNLLNSSTIVASLFSFLSGLFVTSFNYLIQLVLIWCSKHQKLDTITRHDISLTKKIVLLQFINAGIIVVLVNVPVDLESDNNAYNTVISMDILQIMVINAFISNLLNYIIYNYEVFKLYSRYKVQNNHQVFTQQQANQIFEFPQVYYKFIEVQIVYKYAYIFKTFWLTAFFLPIVPFVTVISFIGLLLNYWLQKYLFNGKYKSPYMISSELNHEILNLLHYTLLWITLGSFIMHYLYANFIYQHIPTDIIIPHILCLLISIVHIIIPFRKMDSIFSDKPIDRFNFNKSYKQAQKQFQINYASTNPAFSMGHIQHKQINILKQVELLDNIKFQSNIRQERSFLRILQMK